MLNRVLSNDLPRSRVLAVVLVGLLLALAFAPFLFPGVKALNVAAKVLVFIVLVASFDLLLGYTGIVSFAHTMFFGIGAYGIAIATTRMGPTWGALGIGLAGALAVSLVLALVIGLFSLRVRAIFFAMITLAVASAFLTLASQLSEFTGGEDGLTFKVPEWLSPSFELWRSPLGVMLDGRLVLLPAVRVALVLLLTLLRIVNSPFGRVLQAIRENEFRAEAIGYRGRRLPHDLQRAVGAVRLPGRRDAGALAALQRAGHLDVVRDHDGRAADRRDRRHGHDLRCCDRRRAVHGGAGLPAGPARLGSEAAARLPWLSALLSPDRWLLWLGVLFVLSVYYFPTGVVGRLRASAASAAHRKG
jgi:branched-chain amino acid transport system permease protein